MCLSQIYDFKTFSVLFLIQRNRGCLYLPKFNHLKIHASFNDFRLKPLVKSLKQKRTIARRRRVLDAFFLVRI